MTSSRVAVVIPTFGRGIAVAKTLECILACDPPPAETWVHIDAADAGVEAELRRTFPSIGIVASAERRGPGGGRHECLSRCRAPFVASFDDDSYPVDGDYFRQVETLFDAHPDAAVLGAAIWHRNEPAIPRSDAWTERPGFTGCGCALRLDAYRQTRGYVPRQVAYGMEETDLSLLLFEKGWRIFDAGQLRVFHDTDLSHHRSAAITKGTLQNTALFAFLHYPLSLWGWGVLQLGSATRFSLMHGRWRGVLPGLVGIPAACLRFKSYRRPLPLKVVRDYIKFRRADNAHG